MSPEDADGMANSVETDQTAPLSAQAYLSKNLGLLLLLFIIFIQRGYFINSSFFQTVFFFPFIKVNICAKTMSLMLFLIAECKTMLCSTDKRLQRRKMFYDQSQ